MKGLGGDGQPLLSIHACDKQARSVQSTLQCRIPESTLSERCPCPIRGHVPSLWVVRGSGWISELLSDPSLQELWLGLQ